MRSTALMPSFDETLTRLLLMFTGAGLITWLAGPLRRAELGLFLFGSLLIGRMARVRFHILGT